MIIADIGVQALPKERSQASPDSAFAFGLAVLAADGSLDSHVLYVVLEPRKSGGRHAHSAEEVLFVAEGTAELTVGDELARLSERSIAIVPAGVPHEAVNVGQGPLRFLAILPSEAVLHLWEATGRPPGVRTFVTPSPGRARRFPTSIAS
jgi:quercetin dioxygenase-like cupin family protein